MTEKFSHKRGSYGHAGEDDGDFLTPGPTSPWDAAGDRGTDSSGPERGARTWDGPDTDSFLRASQSESLPGTSKDVYSVYGDVMAGQGPGEYGAGGSSVKQVGGGSSPPRYPAKSSRQARKDQGNGGW